ncbi:MAG: DUF438 domain-containing protein [Sphaerochaetaceae bacterium]
MSNTKEYRQNLLKSLIQRLHGGEDFEAVKADFTKEFQNVEANEIAAMEKALIDEGSVKVEEVQKLCDVHAALFNDSVASIHQDKDKRKEEGHPTWILKEENRAIENLFKKRIETNLKSLNTGDFSALEKLTEDLKDLWQIDLHYSKKENLWFPIMERYGITAPPKVMWAVDDEIRAMIKESRSLLAKLRESKSPSADAIKAFTDQLEATKTKIVDMISKEENILIPMASEVFFTTDWRQIREQSPEIGYTLLDEHPTFEVPKEATIGKMVTTDSQGDVKFPTGTLSPKVLNHLLNTLPIDITFVDADNKVAYFSQVKERIFARTTAVIGRDVSNCHPPASVHIVEKIVEQLKSGEKDNADFYLHLGDKYVYIRYFAVRDDDGKFLGTLEVTQNIADIQKLKGDKRLLDW